MGKRTWQIDSHYSSPEVKRDLKREVRRARRRAEASAAIDSEFDLMPSRFTRGFD